MHTLLVMRFALTLLVLLLGDGRALPPASTAAQVYTFAITIHDASGRGLAEITIIVRDEDGHELTRMVSDADGAASFAALPAVVRVAVEGQARGGPRLYQLGDDAAGVRLDLGQADGSPQLTLRVERDGLVLPDPATMLSLEEGGPVVTDAFPFPTALLATPAPLPTAGASTGVVAVGQSTPPAERRDRWVPLVTVLLIAVAAGVMLLVQRRRDAR
jgi:hypothetical protein